MGVKPFSATWIGYSRRPATVIDTPPASLTAPAARSHSGWCTAMALTPASPAGLLVRRTGEQDVAAQAGDRVAGRVQAGRSRLGDEQLDHAELERDHVLHVDRAAAVHVAVRDLPGERVVGPAIGRGGHDVEMGQQQERLAAGAVATQPDVDRGTARDDLQQLRLEAEGGQAVGEVACDPRLAVGPQASVAD